MTSTHSPSSSTRSARPRPRAERRILLALALALAALAFVVTARADEPAPAPTPDAVTRALDEVLADPVLRDGLTTSHVDAAAAGDVLAEGSRHLWNEFRRWSFRMAKANPVLFLAVSLAMLLALIPLLAHIGWSLTVAFRGVRAGTPAAEHTVTIRRLKSKNSTAAHLLVSFEEMGGPESVQRRETEVDVRQVEGALA